jgi:hypothetical protein
MLRTEVLVTMPFNSLVKVAQTRVVNCPRLQNRVGVGLGKRYFFAVCLCSSVSCCGVSDAQILDTSVGRVYYFNHDTQESTWDAPKEFQKGFFFTQAARKLLVVSVLSTVATSTLSAMRELTTSPLLSTMGVVETAEAVADARGAGTSEGQVADASSSQSVETQPIFSVDGATGLYAVDHIIVFADPESGCPYYFDTLTGQSCWEEPPEVAAFKTAHPDLFPEGFDENALCDTAMFEAEAEVAQLDADPTRHPDFIGESSLRVSRCVRPGAHVLVSRGRLAQRVWGTGTFSTTRSRSVVTIGIRRRVTPHGMPLRTYVNCGMQRPHLRHLELACCTSRRWVRVWNGRRSSRRFGWVNCPLPTNTRMLALVWASYWTATAAKSPRKRRNAARKVVSEQEECRRKQRSCRLWRCMLTATLVMRL